MKSGERSRVLSAANPRLAEHSPALLAVESVVARTMDAGVVDGSLMARDTFVYGPLMIHALTAVAT